MLPDHAEPTHTSFSDQDWDVVATRQLLQESML
jgi:hypothetical protein